MVGRVYEVHGRTEANTTSGAGGPWQVFEGGLVRVVVQGAGWPTNVLVERVTRVVTTTATYYVATGERFVRPARGMRKVILTERHPVATVGAATPTSP